MLVVTRTARLSKQSQFYLLQDQLDLRLLPPFHVYSSRNRGKSISYTTDLVRTGYGSRQGEIARCIRQHSNIG